MKRIISYIAICTLAAIVAVGCSKDREESGGKGRLTFSVAFEGEKATRADYFNAPNPANCVIKIANSEGVIHKFESLDALPPELWLVSGDYTVMVEGGNKVASAFNSPYYKGSAPFTITAGDVTDVEVNCPIQNALFAVTFDESVTTYMADYSVVITPDADNRAKDLEFDATRKDDIGYVLLEKGQTALTWSFTAMHEDFGKVEKSGTLTGLEARKKYDLTFKYTPESGDFIRGFEVTVDETTVDKSHNIPIFQRPKFTAMNFDISQTQLPADAYEIIVTASADIEHIVLTGSVFGTAGLDVMAEGADPGSRGVQVDVIEGAKIGLTFISALFNSMPGGNNDITITAVDKNTKTNNVVFRIMTSGTSDVRRVDIWATHVTVKGSVLEEGAANVKFDYRKTGAADWTEVAAVAGDNGSYSARIISLEPGTEYEVCLRVDGVYKGDPVVFRTEAAFQPPNAGFEDWHTSSKTYWAYPQGGTKYWDSGNSASAGMLGVDYNMTNKDTDKRPGSTGTYSAKLTSLNAILKFAAGNLFTGEFAGLDGTNGTINFGRKFTSDPSRPTSLHGWYKANPVKVTHRGSGGPAKGEMDEYQIYVALTDWDKPHFLNTKYTNTFMQFDPNHPNATTGIIAYGELSGSTSVGAWTEFNIDFKYRDTERLPTYLLIVCSSSRYGDYFTGGEGSWLMVDDLELVYNNTIVLQD